MTGVVLNEIMVNPVGSDTEGEFIEFLNKSNEKINLASFKITDKSGKEFNLTGYEIEPHDRLLLEYKQTKITLNNQGETVVLWQGGKIIDETKIPITEEGMSWSRKGEIWQLTEISTPGEENILPEPEIRIGDFSGKEINSNGIISVILPGAVMCLVLAGVGIWIISKINLIK